MKIPSYLRRNQFGLAFLALVLIAFVCAFLFVGSGYKIPAIAGAIGFTLTGIFGLLKPKKFERTYSDDEWVFDPKKEAFPKLLIPETIHSMGSKVTIDLIQEQYPSHADPDSGDVTILRDNNSLTRPYKDLTVIIKENKG